MERWPSGRRRRFAKPLYGSYRIEGSNPSLSAKANSHILFCPNNKYSSNNNEYTATVFF